MSKDCASGRHTIFLTGTQLRLILAIALICILIIAFAALITIAGYCIAKYGERRAADKEDGPGRPQ
jgi:ABC-type uncharacterized transport system permease subunit